MENDDNEDWDYEGPALKQIVKKESIKKVVGAHGVRLFCREFNMYCNETGTSIKPKNRNKNGFTTFYFENCTDYEKKIVWGPVFENVTKIYFIKCDDSFVRNTLRKKSSFPDIQQIYFKGKLDGLGSNATNFLREFDISLYIIHKDSESIDKFTDEFKVDVF